MTKIIFSFFLKIKTQIKKNTNKKKIFTAVTLRINMWIGRFFYIFHENDLVHTTFFV